MRERPIIFNGPMVRAILDGRKTQTRRPVKTGLKEFSTRDIGSGCTETIWHDDKRLLSAGGGGDTRAHVLAKICPYGKPGDRLWVRETWHCSDPARAQDVMSRLEGVYYSATDPHPEQLRWRPSIHMPRWASRITLEITGVRVERVRDISEVDAKAEGASPYDPTAYFRVGEMGSEMADFEYRAGFADLWESIYGLGEFRRSAHPWVWVVEFKRVAPQSPPREGE